MQMNAFCSALLLQATCLLLVPVPEACMQAPVPDWCVSELGGGGDTHSNRKDAESADGSVDQENVSVTNEANKK